jgi:predicted nucleotidyltransferase
MTDLSRLLRLFSEHKVEYIIIGGVAAVVHGSSRLTQDIDVVYERSKENLKQLVRALADEEPYLRGAPPGLPFDWSPETLQHGLNFTLQTKIGPIDILGEVTGGGGFHDLIEHTIDVDLFGVRCRCLDLPALIRTKRAAGRPRDIEAIAELEAIFEERQRTPNDQ